MEKFKERLHHLWLRCLGVFPHALPVGRSEFDEFSGRIFRAYNLPRSEGYVQAVATMIMHLPPQAHKAPPLYFARSIKKAMSNEVAFNIIQEQKQKDRETMIQEKNIAGNLN